MFGFSKRREYHVETLDRIIEAKDREIKRLRDEFDIAKRALTARGVDWQTAQVESYVADAEKSVPFYDNVIVGVDSGWPVAAAVHNALREKYPDWKWAIEGASRHDWYPNPDRVQVYGRRHRETRTASPTA